MKRLQVQQKLIFLLVAIIIGLIYTGILAKGKLRTSPHKSNYFKELSISLSQGRLDINLPPHSDGHDLVFLKGKYYLYWPPVPALVYMPLTALFERDTPDTVIVNCFGALNIFLLMILLNLFSKRYELNLNNTVIIFLAVFWGLGTVHFYMSMRGSVWFTAQIMANTFLMLSVICILKKNSLINLFLSGLFYAMTVYTKNNLLFSIPLIGAIYITKNKNNEKRNLIKDTIIFLMPFIALSAANLAYNWARFGSIFDNGINYHKMSERFLEDFYMYGCLSLRYVPRNFIREVILPPPLTKHFPFLKFDPEGFGFLAASPVFVLIFATAFYYINGFRKHILKHQLNTAFSYNDIIVMSAAAISGILTSFVIFMVIGTGWMQFASRYSLDYQLMVLLFGVFIIKIWNRNKIFNTVAIILLLISIYINCCGAIFCKFL